MSNDNIQKFLVDNIPGHPRDIVTFSLNTLGCSRTTIVRHLNHLIKQNKVIKSGRKKGITYSLVDSGKKILKIDLTAGCDEFSIWEDNFYSQVRNLNSNVSDICEYAFTEMLNNAIDHSLGSSATITLQNLNGTLNFTITDNGIGIFKKVATALSLTDYREAILHLEKGKFTTDSVNHTGEGLFFTSRIADKFTVSANGISYLRDNLDNDWFIESIDKTSGTKIDFSISNSSDKCLIDLFNNYQDDNSLAFVKTDVTVELSKLGYDRYISRSQAKRIMRNLDKFTEITLDFTKVRMVGQGFVDEIFRVFKNKNPDKTIKYKNANNDVTFMIERGKKNKE